MEFSLYVFTVFTEFSDNKKTRKSCGNRKRRIPHHVASTHCAAVSGGGVVPHPGQGGYRILVGGYPRWGTPQMAKLEYPPCQDGVPPARMGYPLAEMGYPLARMGYPLAEMGTPLPRWGTPCQQTDRHG